jgi:PAS domain S-box-containing protein
VFSGIIEAVQQAAASIVITDADGNIQFVNQAFTSRTGYTSQEVLGKNPRILNSGTHSPAFFADLWKTIRAGNVWLGELVNRRKDGSFYTEETRIAPVRNRLGEISGYIATKQDVPEPRTAEQSHRTPDVSMLQEAAEAQALLASIVESSKDAISSADLHGTIVSWNRAAEALLGYSREEILGQNISVLAMPDRIDRMRKLLEAVSQGNSIIPFDAILRDKDGRGVDVSFSVFPVRNAEGKIVGSSGIARDIRERLYTERKLLESEREFSRVFEYAPFGICVTTLNGQYLMVNSALCSMVGYSREEMLAMSWLDLTLPEDVPSSQEMMERLLESSGETQEWEKRYRHRDGQIIWARLKVSLVRDDHGALPHILIHVENITESRRTEAALAESEIRFRRIFENNGLVMLFADAESGAIVSANHAAADFFGYSRESLTTMSMDEFDSLPPEDVAMQRLRARREKQLCFDSCYKLSNGEERDVEVYSSSIDMDGRPMLFSIVHDVSKRVRSDMKLRESEEKFRLLTENIREVFWIMNGTGTEMLYLSPAFEHVWGLPREAVYRNPGILMEAIHAEDREHIQVELQRQLRGENTKLEFRVVLDGHEQRWIQDRAFPICSPNGSVQRIVGFAENITERKEAEAKLQEATDRLTLATRAGGVGVWVYEIVGNRMIFDEQMCRLYGVEADAYAGTIEAWQAMVHPDDWQRIHQEAQFFTQGNRNSEFDFRIVWPDGSIHHIRSFSLGQEDAAGQLVRVIGTNWDITAQKQAAEAVLERTSILPRRPNAPEFWPKKQTAPMPPKANSWPT